MMDGSNSSSSAAGAGAGAGAGGAALAPLRIAESHESTGDRVWDAGVMLARELEARHGAGRLLRPPSEGPLLVAEIGCGQALASMVVARLAESAAAAGAAGVGGADGAGAAAVPAEPDAAPRVRIIATDLPAVAARAAANVARNGIRGEVLRCEALPWGDAAAAARAVAWLGRRPHLVIASDLATREAFVRPCAETFRALLAQDSALLLCLHSHRDSTRPLLERLQEFGCRLSSLAVDGKLELFEGALAGPG
jgi:hypothetical protein